eukprot:XP_016659752.1 PREDICTED: uncharacterized protein LOC103309404 isoform X2 [Acyrthosiphon pisum]
MYELPSLVKTAYNACNPIERAKYDLLRTRHADLRFCCKSLFALFKADRNTDEDDSRETMYSRSSLPSGFGKVCEAAALYGHIDCLRLARAIGVPWDDRLYLNTHNIVGAMSLGLACKMAAISGHLDCLRYAWENVITCGSAAYNGHIDCLRYARDNGCPWDENTCAAAANNGHIDCLRYARDNGCPWDERTYIAASRNGHLDCLNYALANGCPSQMDDRVVESDGEDWSSSD